MIQVQILVYNAMDFVAKSRVGLANAIANMADTSSAFIFIMISKDNM